MKKAIKIKESQLRELVKKIILRETSYRNLAHMAVPGETDAELEKNWVGRTTAGMNMDDYGNNGDISGFMVPDAKKLKSKEAQNDASWDAYDEVAGITDLYRDNYKDFYDLDKNVNYDDNRSHAMEYANHDAYFVGDDPDPIAEAVRKSIKKVLKESERHEIFTLDIFDIENENGIDDMQYARDYESEDEAIQAAREVAQKYADMDTVINVFVMAGEYMDAQGNVLGEPDAIYCVSNKDRETTMQARTNAGYSNPEVNEYADEGQIGDSSKVPGVTNESKLHAIIKESIKKVLNEEYGVDIQDTLAWVQKKHPDMSPEEQERFARNIIKKREHDNYVFDMHMATSGGNDSFKRELTWDEAKRCYMKYGRYIDEISYKDKRYGPYAEWNEFNPKAFFDEDGE